MKNLIIKATMIAAILLACGSASAAQISIGVRIGPPPPPRVVRVVQYRPGPEFVWIEGYWYPVGRHYRWHDGYWTRPPYPGAYWVAPRYGEGLFIGGFWNGERRWVEHGRHWDRGYDRDFREYHYRGHDRHGDHD